MTDFEKEHSNKCRHTEDGVCPQHNVLLERRKQEAKLINAIPGILTTQNRLIGGTRVIALMATLVIVAGFVYTKDTKLDLEKSVEQNKADQLRIIEKLEQTHDDSLSDLADDLKEHKNSQKELVVTMQVLTEAIKKTYGNNLP